MTPDHHLGFALCAVLFALLAAVVQLCINLSAGKPWRPPGPPPTFPLFPPF